MEPERRSPGSKPWRTISLFLILTLCLTGLFGGLMAFQGAAPAVLMTATMWSPGLAALLTCLIIGRPIASLPWRWGGWGWTTFAWLLPVVYGLAIYTPVWVFNLGGTGFGDPETLTSWTAQLTGGDTANLFVAAAFVVMLGTFGVISSAARALGEEIGWRGFLIWEMRKVMPFWAVGLVSGAIWAVWHWPAILFIDYNAGVGSFILQMTLFTLAILPQGITYAFLTFKTQSLWPAVILHASHNLFIQRVFTPITIEGERSHIYIDEFGIMMPLLGCFMALGFYLWARADGLASDDRPEAQG